MLKRGIKKWDFVLILFNCIIGAGIFGLPSKIFALSGVYSIPAFFLCALLMMIIILNFAEVGSQFKETGGNYLYALKAFGKYPGYINGWLALISRITAFAALANLLVDYLSYFNVQFNNPGVRAVAILLITGFLFFLNIRGLKSSSLFNNIMAVAKLVPLLIFVFVGFFFLDTDLLDFSQPAPDITDFSSTILVLVFAFTGFEGGLINTGEMANPAKDIPFALIFSLLFVSVFYILIQIVSIGTYPALASSDKPLADAANHFLGPGGGSLITMGAIISIGGTLNVIILAGSRLPYAMSEENQFPKIFSKTNEKTGIPYISLIAFTIITLLVSVTGTFMYALSISVIVRVIIYIFVCLAVIKLRRMNGGKAIGFKMRYGYSMAVLGIILSIWLLYTADISDFTGVVITTLAGLILYWIFTSFSKKNEAKINTTTSHKRNSGKV